MFWFADVQRDLFFSPKGAIHRPSIRQLLVVFQSTGQEQTRNVLRWGASGAGSFMYITLCIWCLWRVEKEQKKSKLKGYDRGRWDSDRFCQSCSPSLLDKYGKEHEKDTSPLPLRLAMHASICSHSFCVRMLT